MAASHRCGLQVRRRADKCAIYTLKDFYLWVRGCRIVAKLEFEATTLVVFELLMIITRIVIVIIAILTTIPSTNNNNNNSNSNISSSL